MLLLAGGAWAGPSVADRVPGHEVRTMQGWTIHLNEELLRDEHRAERRNGLEVINFHLGRIRRILRKKKVRRLQKIPIVLDLRHEELNSMQYHPSANWLREHGYAEEMEKMVHIPRLKQFTSRRKFMNQPMVLMHELSHGYHDQVLGFDNEELRTLYKRVKSSGRLNEVLHISGDTKRHYALEDHKEFFAEMTEAYLGTNDFYPFVSGELKADFPRIYAFLKKIWGPVT